jgi:hypothetical protein
MVTLNHWRNMFKVRLVIAKGRKRSNKFGFGSTIGFSAEISSFLILVTETLSDHHLPQ